jgi:subtilisin family serine protease
MLFVFVVLALGSSLSSGTSDAAPPSRSLAARATPHTLRYAPQEIVVITRKGAFETAPDDRPATTRAALARVLAEQGLDRARRADRAPVAGAGRAEVWVLSSRAPGFDPVAASAALRRTGEVLAASPNYRFALFFTQPSDVYLTYQWYVDDPNGANIHLPDAWDTARGDTSVTIAIIDTGVDTGHPDLASKIWHNRDEIPGNGIDDDGNGYVDDWQGWDFGVGDNDPNPEYTSDPSGLDVGFHGTFCAGIAAAATNNGDGIAGAGWNCRIMALKVAHPDSGITSEAIAGAFA